MHKFITLPAGAKLQPIRSNVAVGKQFYEITYSLLYTAEANFEREYGSIIENEVLRVLEAIDRHRKAQGNVPVDVREIITKTLGLPRQTSEAVAPNGITLLSILAEYIEIRFGLQTNKIYARRRKQLSVFGTIQHFEDVRSVFNPKSVYTLNNSVYQSLADFNEILRHNPRIVRIPFLVLQGEEGRKKNVFLPVNDDLIETFAKLMEVLGNAEEVFFTYFMPYEFERYLSALLTAWELSNLAEAYYHYAEAKRVEVSTYTFDALSRVIRWAYENGLSEVFIKPVLGKDGNAIRIEIYGKLGSGLHIPIPPEILPKFDPYTYTTILEDMLRRHGAEMKVSSYDTIASTPESYTFKVGGIDTRWAFIPLGRHTSRQDLKKKPPLAVIRVYSGETKFKTLDDLDLHPKAREIIEYLLPTDERPTPPVGLVAIAGRTDSGKSTMLGIIAQHLASKGLDVAMLEDPIEQYLTGVNQTNVIVPAELKKVKYEDAVRLEEEFIQKWLDAQLRANPDVVIVGEVRNEMMMRKLLQLVKTGKLVFITIHASSTIKVLSRLVGLGMSLEELSSDLLGVIFLTLIRKPHPNAVVMASRNQYLAELQKKFPPDDLSLVASDMSGILNLPDAGAWNPNHKGAKYIKERLQVGTYALLSTTARTRLSELLAEKGLKDMNAIKSVIASSSLFLPMLEFFKSYVAKGEIPIELAVATALAYDEVYPVRSTAHKGGR